MSASYFKGKDDYLWTNGQYRDVEIFGGDFIGTIGEIALWVEGAYTEPEIGDSSFQIAAGGEYTFGNDLYIYGAILSPELLQLKRTLFDGCIAPPFQGYSHVQNS